jgi:hypothetical protein
MLKLSGFAKKKESPQCPLSEVDTGEEGYGVQSFIMRPTSSELARIFRLLTSCSLVATVIFD